MMESYSRRRRVLWLALLLLLSLVFSFAWTGCKEERRSAGEKPQVADENKDSAKDSLINAGNNDEAQNVAPTKPHENVELDTEKANRLVNQLSNYTMSICSDDSCPADLDALKPILKERFKLSWPKDPWGSPYSYKKIDDSNFEIISLGPDKTEGTEDDIKRTPDKEYNK